MQAPDELSPMANVERGSCPRICFVTPSFPPAMGGVGVAARRIVRYLSDAGYEVHVVTWLEAPHEKVLRKERAEEDSALVHRLLHPAGDESVPFVFREFVRELDEEHSFSLFHGFFLSAAYPCIRPALSGASPRPVIASIRGSDVAVLLDMPFSRPMILRTLKKANWVTSVNQAYLDRASEEVELRGRCSVIRNGIKPSAWAGSWQLGEVNRGVVGTIGEFRAVKDIPLLVRGYAQVPEPIRRRLLLAGAFASDSGDEARWTETLVAELLRVNEAELTGFFQRDALSRHLAAMNVYVQSSAFEGMPNALLEAASFGVPLVATEVGGMKEILRDGETALLVPHGDPARLAAAVSRVLSDDALAMRLSKGALSLAESFGADRERLAWLALYQQLLAPPADPGPLDLSHPRKKPG